MRVCVRSQLFDDVCPSATKPSAASKAPRRRDVSAIRRSAARRNSSTSGPSTAGSPESSAAAKRSISACNLAVSIRELSHDPPTRKGVERGSEKRTPKFSMSAARASPRTPEQQGRAFEFSELLNPSTAEVLNRLSLSRGVGKGVRILTSVLARPRTFLARADCAVAGAQPVPATERPLSDTRLGMRT